MDKEYLENYHSKEKEEMDKFLKNIYEEELNSSYPDRDRFHKLREPVGKAFFPTESIWPQIPLFGSLIIEISPVPENLFYQFHGIEKKDLEKLIDFSKETGKVQFMMNGDPESFIGLDFLLPLFEEMRPPISYSIPMASLFELNELKNYMHEFDTLIDLPSQRGMNFKDIHNYIVKLGVTQYSLNEVLDENRIYYAFLRGYGYDNIVDCFEDLLIIDSKKAALFLAGMGKLIIEPKLESFKSDRIFSFEALTELNYSLNSIDLIGKPNNIHEIGKFLFNKLTFMPESFEACKDVIARYKQEDLYKVSSSLHEGVIKQDQDLVCKKKFELTEILDNVWSDAKLENRIKGVNYGIPISMALVGTLASGALAGGVGLLAGLGIEGVSEIFDQESIGEKLAKKTVPDHVVNIFDFKKAPSGQFNV
ncbi:Uncharacterised protein [uncultured archaeon]|nr:Uncharacterised protein [uncultured archaeon]